MIFSSEKKSGKRSGKDLCSLPKIAKLESVLNLFSVTIGHNDDAGVAGIPSGRQRFFRSRAVRSVPTAEVLAPKRRLATRDFATDFCCFGAQFRCPKDKIQSFTQGTAETSL